MSTRKVILVSFLSSLITIAVIFSILFPVSMAMAQGRAPQTAGALQLAAAEPTTAPAAPAQMGPDADLDPNQGAPAVSSAPDEAVELSSADVKTVYQHVAGSVFTPLYGDAGAMYGSKGCVYTSNAAHPWLNYPLVVPPGSTITSLQLYFNDTNTTINGNLHLTRYDDGIDYQYLATVTTTGSSGLSYATVENLSIVPDYFNYSYSLYWVPYSADGSIQLCGYRISYIPPSVFGIALPAITK